MNSSNLLHFGRWRDAQRRCYRYWRVFRWRVLTPTKERYWLVFRWRVSTPTTEREKGVVNDGVNNKISVFQGPIYDDKIDLWADDFQIPSKYFKIAVWRNKQKELRSVGLIVDQSNLLTEERKNLGKPKPANNINVNEWRISIKEIEKLTNLKFGEAIISADTISSVDQPNVGEESFAKTMILDWEYLLR